MSDHDAGYACPACGATATLTAPCPGCGRAPDPDAALVVSLNAKLIELTAAEADARRAHVTAYQELARTQKERNDAAARIRFAVSEAARAAQGLAPTVPASSPSPVGAVPAVGAPESSPRTVQNILFVIGGILLGTAAIVFTAVAWVNFSVVGRAAILGVATAILLAVPLFARRRRLIGTAETFAALGLLFVVLDGYAAWKVDIFEVVSRVSVQRYAAGVFAVTALIGFAYWGGTRLKAPLIAGGLAAQPVLPLAIAPLHPGPAGWAAVALGVAAANMAVLWARGRRRDVFAAITSGMIGTWLLVTLPFLIQAAFTAEGAASHRVTLVFVAAGLAWALWAYVTRTGYAAGGAILVVFVETGLLRDIAVADYQYRGILTAAAIAIVLVATGLRAGGTAQLGARIAGVVFAGGYFAVATATAAAAAVRVIDRAVPWWHADGGGALLYRWELPIGVAIVAVSAGLVNRRWAWLIGTGAVPLIALLLTASVRLPWWGPAALIVAAATIIMVAGATLAPATGGVREAGAAVAAPLLVIGAAAGFARPVGTLGVGVAVLLVGLTVGLLDRRRSGAPGILAVVSAAASAPIVGLALVKVINPDARDYLVLRGAAAATLLAVVCWCTAIRLGRLSAERYRWAGSVTILLAVNVIGAAPAFGVGDDPAVYAAGALAIAVGLILVAQRKLVVAGVPLLLTALVTLLPGFYSVLLQPYAWVDDIWSGRPDGLGLAPQGEWKGVASDPIAWLLLGFTVGALITLFGKRLRIALLFGLYPAGLAVLTLLAAQDVAWPAIPVAAMAIAVVAAVWSARIADGSAIAGLAGAALFGGAGLAGCLPTKASTLAGLSAVVIVSIVAAGVARTDAARVAGTTTSALSILTLGLVAPLAASESIHRAAFGVLAAAAVLLAAGYGIRRRETEALVLTLAAHGGAVVAFLLSLPRLANGATVAVLWALALGVRALLPGARRVGYLVGAGGSLLLALWLTLAAQGIGILEAYTAPLAVIALAAGVLLGRDRPGLNSWQRYGVALVAGFLPSLAQIVVSEGNPWRRLFLGIGGLAVLLVGTSLRLRAWFVTGSIVLVIIALHEIVLLWDRLPRWIPLGVAGLLVIAVAIRYEWTRSRARDLREKVAQMS